MNSFHDLFWVHPGSLKNTQKFRQIIFLSMSFNQLMPKYYWGNTFR